MAEEPWEPSCTHQHCRDRLFFDAEPLHDHFRHDQMCHHCHRDRVFVESLKRCKGCFLCSYCSPECQNADWQKHKKSCKAWSWWKDRATELSGDSNAWEQFQRFRRFHHNSFVNSALAAYLFLQPEETFPDVASDNLVVTTLEYRNDPAVPAERKFEFHGTQYMEKRDPEIAVLREQWSHGYDETVQMGRRLHGDSYRGTGTYVLLVRFGPEDPLAPLMWAEHFNIDEARARAQLACRDAIKQLKENIEEGKKMRICCRTYSERWPCCCEGWTHDDDYDDDWDEEDDWDDWYDDDDDEYDE